LFGDFSTASGQMVASSIESDERSRLRQKNTRIKQTAITILFCITAV